MERILNNEVDVLNIASLDNDIKDSFTRAMITEDVNTTSAAVRRYLKGEYFIHTDRYLYKALEDIAAGTTITPDVNAEVVTVSEELVRLFAQSPEGIFEILSNIENTSVASKNYVKGSQFIWTDKKLYEATADITSGSTFVVDTNIKPADNLTSQIQTLTNNDEAMLNVLGAKNLLQNNLSDFVNGGITVTVNADKSITVNGTVSASAIPFFTFASNINVPFTGDYILTKAGDDAFITSDTSDWNYLILIHDNTANVDVTNSTNTDKLVHLDETHLYTISFAVNGFSSTPKTFSNQIVYPMLRPASIADDTYVPYAMTNRKLTGEVTRVKKVFNQSVTPDSIGMFAFLEFSRGVPIMCIVPSATNVILSTPFRGGDGTAWWCKATDLSGNPVTTPLTVTYEYFTI